MVISSNFSIPETLEYLVLIGKDKSESLLRNPDVKGDTLVAIWMDIYRHIGGKEFDSKHELNMHVAAESHIRGFKENAILGGKKLFKLVDGQVRRNLELKELLRKTNESVVLDVNSAYPTALCIGLTQGVITLGSYDVEEFYKACCLYSDILRKPYKMMTKSVLKNAVNKALGGFATDDEIRTEMELVRLKVNIIKNSLGGFCSHTFKEMLGFKPLKLVHSNMKDYDVTEPYTEIIHKYSDIISNGLVDTWIMKDRHSLLVLSMNLKMAGFSTEYKSTF